ncbi:uncharacterized protein B0H18DRAFT_1103212 [Fomitopsis serialis]|uniref:uncharacterized protein n=1 Tax=Fomitopsis serialis TaxID=139415 RepID=UPI002008ACF3|nr:uncharacterized protein B0H18DRAFT_1103212 [Neoantrodia serialis]KAH9930045.1 hypothetical protein B0H18DRAFT_1103212 [Neoantrodia serialis]
MPRRRLCNLKNLGNHTSGLKRVQVVLEAEHGKENMDPETQWTSDHCLSLRGYLSTGANLRPPAISIRQSGVWIGPGDGEETFTWDTYFVQNCCTAAAFSIYLYDRALTFSREVDTVWRRPKWGFCALYAAMHVSAILYFSANVATWAGLDCRRDRSIYPIYGASWCVLCALLGVITAQRVYGICQGRWPLPALVLTLFLLGPIYAIVSVIYTVYQDVPLPIYCLIGSKRFVFTMHIMADAIVLLVTWRATYAGYKEARRSKAPIFKFTQLFLQNGSVHFGVLLGFNIVVLSAWAVNALECSMLVDIFVIGIREVAYHDDSASTPSEMSDVYFFDPDRSGTPDGEDAVSDMSGYGDEKRDESGWPSGRGVHCLRNSKITVYSSMRSNIT